MKTGDALGGEREKSMKKSGINNKREDLVSSKAPDFVEVSREEYERLEKIKEDCSLLIAEINELYDRYCGFCHNTKNPFDQLKEIERVFNGERMDSRMSTDRVRGLLGAVVHLGHYCDDTEMKMREYIQKQKDKYKQA